MPSTYIGPEAGRAAWEAAHAHDVEQEELAAQLRQDAEQSVAMNQALINQLTSQIAYADAVANDPTPDISTAQMLAVMKNLANVLSGAARAATICLEQLKAHAQLIVGTYDPTAHTGGPGPVA